MKVVGIRELKNRLSAYLQMVRRGEEVLVTDRGEVVAQLSPPGATGVDAEYSAPLLRLSRQGRLILGAPNEARIYPRLKPIAENGTAARLLDEERGVR